MCGIAGQVLLDPSARPAPEIVRAMTAALVHRGPDDEGFHSGPGIELGFRRLATIDLSGGHQPMSDAEGRIHVVFNGEIYDHKEVRRGLEQDGARFRTHSDTEVLVHGYRRFGASLPERVNGMFAMACWDAKERTLLLARDRAGKKPLHYLVHEGALWFASEIKALLAVPGWDRAVDLEALDVYLSQQFIPAPLTIYRNVRKLPPAHRMVIAGGRTEISRYWTPKFVPKLGARAESGGLDDGVLVEELREITKRAVRRRLESEVPLGAYLSGGLDSSTIVGLMSAETAEPVRTYTIGFEEEEFDERPFARVVAQHFGTEHHEFVVRPDVVHDLPRIQAQYDEPYADKSAVPTWYVAREAAREITVVFTGDGADDVFAGYGRYDASAIERAFSRLPGSVRSLVEHPALRALTDPARGGGLSYAVARAVKKSLAPHLRSIVIPAFFDAHTKRSLYRPEVVRGLASGNGERGMNDLAERLYTGTRDLPEILDRMLAVDFEQYLAGDLLPKVDIASMAHSLEPRSPFLDTEVIEFALRLPDRLRVRGGEGKWILKKAFEDFLPKGIAWRKKHGFSVPVDRWLAKDLAPMLRELLVESPTATEWFDPAAVRRMVDEHTAGARKHGSRLWALLCFELWNRSARGTSTPAPVARPTNRGAARRG